MKREYLIKLREKVGLAQNKTAQKLYISQSYYWKYESGGGRMTVEFAVELAKVLMCDPLDIVRGELDWLKGGQH